MRSVRLHSYNQSPSIDLVPEPEISHPFDVLVRIGGAGLCRTDIHIVEGQWREKSGVALPYTLGHENAGWVAAVGSAVEHFSVGDPVIVHPLATCGFCLACRAGNDMHCMSSAFPGIDSDGGFAEVLRTNARALVKLEGGLSPADVAALADAGLTAYHAVRKASPLLPPGSSAVVIGAGGLGHIAIQVLAAVTEAEIIVVDRSEAALDMASSFGAHYQVLADGSEVASVMDLTGGKGVQVVLDFVAEGGAERRGPAMLQRAGSYFVVGYGGTVELATIDIISSELNVVGNLVGSYTDLVELMALAARGSVKLHTAKYPLDAFAQAFEDLQAGRVRGRAILVP